MKILHATRLRPSGHGSPPGSPHDPGRNKPPLIQVLLAWVIIMVLTLPPTGQAGSGSVNRDGTIDFTMNFRYPPDPADIMTYSNQVVAASGFIWDATDGQMWLGNVTFTAGAVNEDLADIWVYPDNLRSGVSFRFDGGSFGTPGAHINLFRDIFSFTPGLTIAHELGHLAFGLCDEYDEQRRFGACWGYGPCIETGAMTEANHCMMQMTGPMSQTEFCSASSHENGATGIGLVGDGIDCATRAVPHGCTNNCEFYNHTTDRYETTQQTANIGRSCWDHLANNFSWLTVPAGLPTAAPPARMPLPNIIDNVNATDTVMLILDRSGSMNWNTESDSGEVCGDLIDNDGDGMVDEMADCTQSRLNFVKAAARAWLNLANGRGVRAGIVSFNESASLDEPFQEVDTGSINALTNAVDSLVAGGNTGIGTALLQTVFTFDAERDALNKTAFLISDGVNTDGPDPESVVGTLRDRDIRVFTISTGGASRDETLSDISGTTSGARVDASSATTLVNAFAQQWGRYQNMGTLIPQEPYRLDGQIKLNEFNVLAEDGAGKITLIFAGDMGDMSGFGVRVLVRSTLDGSLLFDTEIPDPAMKIVKDPYFMMIEVENILAGEWLVEFLPAPGASLVQTGHLTVLTDNPLVELVTSLDRQVVTDPRVPVHVSVEPSYLTALRQVDSMTGVLRWPDGTLKVVPVESNYEKDGATAYSAKIDHMPMAGMYRLDVFMSTGPGTFNDPGEPIFDSAPESSLPVPELRRRTRNYFYVEPPADDNQEAFWFHGLKHGPVGQAQVDEQENGLLVTEIGQSGLDGVRVFLGQADYLWTTLNGLDPKKGPDGAALQIIPRGSVQGLPDQNLGRIIMKDIGDTVIYTADFSETGATSHTLVYLKEDQEVARLTGVDRDQPVVELDHGPIISLDPCWRMPECWWIMRFGLPGQPPTIRIPDGSLIDADAVMVIPEGPVLGVAHLSEVEILGIGLESFFIRSHELGKFHHGHRALGRARMVGLGDTLEVSNLRGGSRNGVSIGVKDGNALSLGWEPLFEGQNPQINDLIHISGEALATGPNGDYSFPVGDLYVRNNGQLLEIGANFSALNSQGQMVEIYHHGQRVAAYAASPQSPAAAVQAWPDGGNVFARPWVPTGPNGPLGPVCLWLDWLDHTRFLTPDNRLVEGDEIRISPIGVNQILIGLLRVDLETRGLEKIVLNRETVSRRGLSYEGTIHHTLGQATLSVPANGGGLVVGNIGSSGEDGIRINAGRADSVIPTLRAFDPRQYPSGTALQFEAVGEVNGTGGQVMMAMTMEDDGDSVTVSPDFSAAQADTYTVLVHDGPDLVVKATGLDAAATRIEELREYILVDPWCMRGECWWVIQFPPPRPEVDPTPTPMIEVEGVGQVRGDQLVLIPETASRNLGYLEDLRITGRGLGAFQLAQIDVGLFHTSHQALGNATLTGDGHQLLVGNLGILGGDGVRFQFRPARHFGVKVPGGFRGIVAGDPSPQPSVTLRAHGLLDGEPGLELSRLWLNGTKEGSILLQSDFGFQGAEQSVIQVFNDGQLVAELNDNANGLLLTRWPEVMGYDVLGGDNPGNGWRLGWEAPIPLPFPGQLNGVMGDEVRVLAGNPEADPESVEEVVLETAGIQPFVITEETHQTVHQPEIRSIRKAGSDVVVRFRAEFGHDYTLLRQRSLGGVEPAEAVETRMGEGAIMRLRVPADGAAGFFQLRMD